MPDHPLGQALTRILDEPPRTLDVTGLVHRARRRSRLRRTLVITGAAAATSVTVLLAASVGGSSHGPSITPATQPPTVAPTNKGVPPPSPFQTPPAVAPDVRGQAIAVAITVLTQADCESGIVSVVNDPAPVGQVISQLQTAATVDVCAVALTVSAGPATPAPECTSLHVTNGDVGAAAGHSAFVVHLRNTGDSLCTLSGYPQVTGIDSTGHRVTAQQGPNGYMGGSSLAGPPPPLRLSAGEQVSVLVEGVNNPGGNATSCPTLDRLRLSVAGHTYPLTGSLWNCAGLFVHPLVPGTTGNLPPAP